MEHVNVSGKEIFLLSKNNKTIININKGIMPRIAELKKLFNNITSRFS